MKKKEILKYLHASENVRDITWKGLHVNVNKRQPLLSPTVLAKVLGHAPVFRASSKWRCGCCAVDLACVLMWT